MAEFESNKKAKVDAAEPAEPAVAQILVKSIDGAVVAAPELPLSATAGELKALVAEKAGKPAFRISLALGDDLTEMDDARSLAANGIGAQAEIMMLIVSQTLETDEAALRSSLTQMGRGDLVDGKSVREWDFVTIEDERVVTARLNGKNCRGASSLTTSQTTSLTIA